MATTLPTTEAFPVAWNVIDDGEGLFSLDRMHFPFPVSPLSASTFPAFSTGHTAGLRSLGIPMQEYQIRTVNHYRFARAVMEAPPSDADAAAQGARIEQMVQGELGRMIDRWYGEHLPRLLELHGRLGEMHPQGKTSAEVLALLDEANAIHTEAWQIHFTIAPLMTLGMQLLREMHADVFGEDEEEAMLLMAGNVTESIKAAFGLADLAQRVRDLDLAETFLSTPVDTLVQTLEQTDAGRTFLSDLTTYLEGYGLRQDLFDLMTPTWREDPRVALASVRSYLETGRDSRAEHARIARRAEAAFDAAKTRLADYPAAVREHFEQMVQLGRQGAFLQEEHNFYIDQRMLSLMRYFYLEVGEHLRDLGLVDRSDDVFMLRLDDIAALVRMGSSDELAREARELVTSRRAELAQAATMSPPTSIGQPNDAPPPPDTPLARSLAAFFGSDAPNLAPAGQVRGTPGSRGVVSGPARVVRTLEEAMAVQPGEILVAITTTPPWTPLFGIAAAIVTETGGPLSHCAVVAREYGIPAVVGAHGATEAIRPGQQMTVDGSTGVVMIGS